MASLISQFIPFVMPQSTAAALNVETFKSRGLLLAPNLRLRVRWSARFIDPFIKMYPVRWLELDELPAAVVPAWEAKDAAVNQLHLLIQRFFNRTGTLPAVGDNLCLSFYSEYLAS